MSNKIVMFVCPFCPLHKRYGMTRKGLRDHIGKEHKRNKYFTDEDIIREEKA